MILQVSWLTLMSTIVDFITFLGRWHRHTFNTGVASPEARYSAQTTTSIDQYRLKSLLLYPILSMQWSFRSEFTKPWSSVVLLWKPGTVRGGPRPIRLLGVIFAREDCGCGWVNVALHSWTHWPLHISPFMRSQALSMWPIQHLDYEHATKR